LNCGLRGSSASAPGAGKGAVAVVCGDVIGNDALGDCADGDADQITYKHGDDGRTENPARRVAGSQTGDDGDCKAGEGEGDGDNS
jgi:hypothetical protein